MSQSLTARELEVLTLAAAGYTNEQIARRLGICFQTVKNALLRTREKLGVPNTTAAAVLAVRRGWLPEVLPEPPREVTFDAAWFDAA